MAGRGRSRRRSEQPALPPSHRPCRGSASASRRCGGQGAPLRFPSLPLSGGGRAAMASYTKAAQQWATFARAWYLLDAKMQPPGKIAAATAMRLEGRHKPIYHALSDCGDHVVIINTRHIAFSGNKWEQKVYSSHTGYPGGFKQVTATQLHLKDPTAIVKLTVYRMLPKNLQRRTMMQRLHLFPEDVIPEDIEKNLLQEIPQPRAVPKRLDEYTPEEIAAFPKIWTPPKDFRRR